MAPRDPVLDTLALVIDYESDEPATDSDSDSESESDSDASVLQHIPEVAPEVPQPEPEEEKEPEEPMEELDPRGLIFFFTRYYQQDAVDEDGNELGIWAQIREWQRGFNAPGNEQEHQESDAQNE